MGVVRLPDLVLVAVLAAAVFPSPGAGAVVGASAGSLYYTAAAGEANRVELTESNGTVTVRDSGAAITVGQGCDQVSANEAVCASVSTASVSLGDLDDTAAIFKRANPFARGEPRVRGGDGDDVITGCGRCRLFAAGDDGDDIITANGFILVGNAGNDTITGGDSSNRLNGGTGDDALWGGDGDDRFLPGLGNDLVRGGSGADVADFAHTGRPVVVDLAAGRATGQGVDTFVSIRNARGSNASDRLIGNGQGNVLRAGSGDDVVIGGVGDDLLVGHAGHDTLRGGRGDDGVRARDGALDVVRGGADRDWASVDRGLDRVRGIQIFR